MQMGRFGGSFSRREHGAERNPGSAGEGGDGPTAIADQMVVLRVDVGEGCPIHSGNRRQQAAKSSALLESLP